MIYVFLEKTISRDFTYVDNILYAIYLVSKYNEKLKKFDIFNIACGKKISLERIYQLKQFFLKNILIKIKIKYTK